MSDDNSKQEGSQEVDISDASNEPSKTRDGDQEVTRQGPTEG